VASDLPLVAELDLERSFSREQFLMDILCEFLRSREKAADRPELLISIERVNEHLGLDYFAMAFLPLTHERSTITSSGNAGRVLGSTAIAHVARSDNNI
jgi:hypothetical protein